MRDLKARPIGPDGATMTAGGDRREHLYTTGGSTLSPRSAVLIAACFGLIGGYIDLGGIVFQKEILNGVLYFYQGRHFPWTVPAAILMLLMVPGVLVAAANWLRPGLVSLPAAAWLFATLALWCPLLRMPLDGTASLVLAAGLGRWIGRAVSALVLRFRWFVPLSLLGLMGLLGGTAAFTYGRQALAEYRAVAGLPPPPPGAGNVVLIILDAVRAGSLSLHGYARDTTPNLMRWAKRGIRFERAMAPAPWTYPSHSSIFTGQWPYKLNAQSKHILDTPYTTLAECLASRGYLTAGFAANTVYCSYETRLNRGFAHYEDYQVSPRNALASTAPGLWLTKNILYPGDFYSHKWIRFQSRDARENTRAFLDWLSRQRRGGRPFFAFLNYLDAHEPFVVPEGAGAHFASHPESARDYLFLMEYWRVNKRSLSERDVTLARDAYEDCIAHLDRQIGELLDDLERRGVLQDTTVIITSDHGEEFGEHGIYDHGYSLYLPEVHVPFVILGSSVPVGRVVSEPVSLRDLPATIIHLAGLSAGSPFTGRPLTADWQSAVSPGRTATTAALSEIARPEALKPQHGRGPTQQGFAMSLVTGELHYIRDSAGAEQLYDLVSDPRELHNLTNTAHGIDAVSGFRRSLLEILIDDPVTIGVEGNYLKSYRAKLELLVHGRRLLPAHTASRPSNHLRGM
jgi:arylsulfatase A-like enzyme